MFVIGVDSKVGEKYLGLGDGRTVTNTRGMEWRRSRRRRRRKKGETETTSEFGTKITANLLPDNERAFGEILSQD